MRELRTDRQTAKFHITNRTKFRFTCAIISMNNLYTHTEVIFPTSNYSSVYSNKSNERSMTHECKTFYLHYNFESGFLSIGLVQSKTIKHSFIVQNCRLFSNCMQIQSFIGETLEIFATRGRHYNYHSKTSVFQNASLQIDLNIIYTKLYITNQSNIHAEIKIYSLASKKI